ncbi:uncharacterized protein LOC127417191 isoform X2 [Myxocyprinus asiaticus]|uniref:uncharacterized protein LOC127417191 isoform X2 n=1 Tax=Myxocyprinus asiaticus TaxID=70543 RepID=UPI002223CF89|nr:uncharacterized protein LOC127417191 isoform X2 [Myxocyprinus asiaticus]
MQRDCWSKMVSLCVKHVAEKWQRNTGTPPTCSLICETDHVDGRVRVRHLPGEEMAAGCTMGRRQAGGGSVMLNVLLGNLGSWHSCGCYFDTYQLPKDCCRPRTPLHGNNIP